MKKLFVKLFSLFLFYSFFSCSQEKINGVNLVSPPSPVKQDSFLSIKNLGANWVSVIPYAICKSYGTELIFNSKHQWWGEKKEGVNELIKIAKNKKLKVMLKPHVWFTGGPATDFTLSSEKEWTIWEQNYSNYILSFAKIAEDNKVDIFCFSTELKQVTIKRPLFFKHIIKDIKKIYSGKLTYAANWDNFKNVGFWKELDFIGVDAYFPLSDEKQPTVKTLEKAWLPIVKKLEDVSNQYQKPILFTEYGFESCDYNTKQTWGSNGKYKPNQQAQSNAYQAMYNVLYSKKWFSGGFLWKWHLTDRTKRNFKTSFTPEGKAAKAVIKHRFKPSELFCN